jgi:TonB family protein
MARHILTLMLLLSCTVAAGGRLGFAQDAETARKVVSKVNPPYPSLARQMHISGNVRLEAVVSSNGKVRLVEIKGGHPVLAQAAVDAVSKWKWEPASQESRESVELRFLPQ